MVKKISVSYFRRFSLLENVPYCIVERETGTRPNEQPLGETLPFENYRTTTNHSSNSRPITTTTTTTANESSTNIYLRPQHNKIPNRNNHSYAGATRLSDDEYEAEEDEDERQAGDDEEDNEREDDDDENEQRRMKRKDSEQIHSQSNMQSVKMTDHFSRNIPSSSFIDTSVRSNPNTSTILMMMKGNGNSNSGVHLANPSHPSSAIRNEKPAYEHRTVVVSSTVRPTSSGSSSSSSSLPVDEQQQQQQQQQQQGHHQIKPRGYNFVPAPFNGSRLIAKSTEQLNRSFANDSLVKYCTPPTTPTSSLFQNSTKDNSPTSILKQNYMQKYTHTSSKQRTSHRLFDE